MYLGSVFTSDGLDDSEIERAILGSIAVNRLRHVLVGSRFSRKLRMKALIVYPVVTYGCATWTLRTPKSWGLQKSS